MVSRKFPVLHIPTYAFTFAKFFGSGVIIATAFIHLLASSFAELGDPCLSTFWNIVYPWSAAFSMIAVFSLFLVELFAMRVAHMQFATTDALGADAEDDEDKHEHGTTYGPPPTLEEGKLQNDPTTQTKSTSPPSTANPPKPIKKLDARLVGFFILEFGVIFHSVIIGLTLSTTGADFNTLFVVIIFHQMFEGLGLGSRLAILPFPPRSALPWLLGAAYAIVTPLGMAIGLGLRTTYDSSSQTALLVSGILDAISSGILLYTGLVELLAHEFLFSNGISLSWGCADCSCA